jgi:Fe-S cluster assembly protein SufD
VSTRAAPADDAEAPVFTSSPRLLVVAGEGAEATVEEEFVAVGAAAAEGAAYAVNCVSEVVLAPRARLSHGVLQRQGTGCVHMHSTRVTQEEASEYAASEVCAGAAVGRHSLAVKQLGKGTRTEMRTFSLAGRKQTQDLHSQLVLDHPEGEAEQLHKCIVYDASGRGVFDGNVRVEKAAQQTDAKQLSRSLLLVPKATTNVKPNLQIVADDVKCTHGATISDLEDEEVFYFLSRGISQEEARKSLVYSFGAEVVDRLPTEATRARARAVVADKLGEWASAAASS